MLQGQQREIYESLQRRDPRLGEMYAGALSALERRQPDHLAQAAHSVRELFDKLPASLGIGFATASGWGNEVEKIVRVWDRARESSCWADGSWSGEIDAPMVLLLQQTESLVEWFRGRPRPRVMVREVMRRFDPGGREVPGVLGRQREQAWMDARRYFVDVSHHQPTDESAFREWLARFESMLVSQLLPRPFADFDELDRLLTEARDGT